MTKLMFVSVVLLFLYGCNSTAEQSTTLEISCDSQDWQTLGYALATSGKHVREFDRYIDKCGETLGPQARSLYTIGYEQGLADYCTYENGYALGKSQKPFENHCIHEMKAEFDRGVQMARVDLTLQRQKLSYLEGEFRKQGEIMSGDLMSAKGKDGP